MTVDSFGKNSWKTRRIMKMMRKEVKMMKKDLAEKNREKIEHLKKSYTKKENKMMQDIPDKIRMFEDISIFQEETTKEEETCPEHKVPILGPVDLDKDEIAALELPPNFSILEKLKEENFNVEQEMCYSKLRWEFFFFFSNFGFFFFFITKFFFLFFLYLPS